MNTHAKVEFRVANKNEVQSMDFASCNEAVSFVSENLAKWDFHVMTMVQDAE